MAVRDIAIQAIRCVVFDGWRGWWRRGIRRRRRRRRGGDIDQQAAQQFVGVVSFQCGSLSTVSAKSVGQVLHPVRQDRAHPVGRVIDRPLEEPATAMQSAPKCSGLLCSPMTPRWPWSAV